MTRHRLIRCDAERVIGCAISLHPDLERTVPEQTMRWFTHGDPPGAAALSWSSRPSVGVLRCCLEIERTACGVLVHLTVTPLIRSGVPGAGRMTRGVAEIWAARQLNSLARLVDAAVTGTTVEAA